MSPHLYAESRAFVHPRKLLTKIPCKPSLIQLPLDCFFTQVTKQARVTHAQEFQKNNNLLFILTLNHWNLSQSSESNPRHQSLALPENLAGLECFYLGVTGIMVTHMIRVTPMCVHVNRSVAIFPYTGMQSGCWLMGMKCTKTTLKRSQGNDKISLFCEFF